MNAQAQAQPQGEYTRHMLIRPNGGSVHELTNAAGQVFAIIWSGPGKPDLRALLGPYFDAMQTATARPRGAMPLRGRPLRVAQSDLRIESSGHMGHFSGMAFVPSLAPPGFSPGDLAPAGLNPAP